jgi:hypothetical protein
MPLNRLKSTLRGRFASVHSKGVKLTEDAGARNSIAAASAATTAAASTGKPARWLGRSAVTRAIRRAENRKLQSVLLSRALRASNLLRLIQHNLLKVRLAILANVFVNWHISILTASVNNHNPS